MEGKESERYEVSAINIKLLKILGIAVLIVITVAAFFTFFVPSKYFFEYDGKEITLCEGRLGWLDGHQVPGLGPFLLNVENAKELTDKTFRNVEEAKSALLEFAQSSLKKQKKDIAELEAKLAQRYTTMLQELIIARDLGIKGVDKQIEVLGDWLDTFGTKHETTKRKERKD